MARVYCAKSVSRAPVWAVRVRVLDRKSGSEGSNSRDAQKTIIHIAKAGTALMNAKCNVQQRLQVFEVVWNSFDTAPGKW